MNLREIKKSYDAIIGLGSACDPALQLRRKNLRTFSSPLDWVVTLSLSDVSRLLKNKFKDYMDLNHMKLIDGKAHVIEDGVIQPLKSYFVKDSYYNIISVHDFPILPHQEWYEILPAFKEKINPRIDRLLEKIINSKSILFIRWAAKYEEVVELKLVLSEMTKGQFHILVLCPEDGLQSVEEMEWGIDQVCSIKVPNLSSDTITWDYALDGITLSQ
ncbi:hypothetical protein D3C73_433410 [compost metagenome]